VSDALPPAAYAAALAALDRMTLPRLAALLRSHPPEAAWEVATGRAAPPPGGLLARVLADDEVRRAWELAARRRAPERVWAACEQLGIAVTFLGDPEHPAAAVLDPLPAPVLFSRGDRRLLEGRRAAVVGTRNATAAGRHVARSLGHDLAAAGVQVVSGLARGIDGAAHAGALAALDAGGGDGCAGRPIGVVASGLDVVYPREHARLWDRVASDGLLLGEAPPGAAPLAHRFPLRNRIVAGLSEVVVVVESRERGGSLITAELAAERGVPVMAVPGRAASRAARGANELLRDGSAPVLGAGDVLVALDLDHRRTGPLHVEHRRPPRPDDVAALDACRERPRTIGDVAGCTGGDLLRAAMSLARLEQAGWIAQVDGWYEAIGSPRV